MKLDELKFSIKEGNLNIVLDESFFMDFFKTSQVVDIPQSCSWWLGSFFTHSCNKGCTFSTCLICSEGCSLGCSSCDTQV